jgi:hypothetical protein
MTNTAARRVSDCGAAIGAIEKSGKAKRAFQAIDYPELSDPKGRKINYGRLE